MDIGMALRAAREQAGETQAALAERLGVSTQTVSEIERGRRHNPTGQLKALNKMLERAYGLRVRVVVEQVEG